MRAMADGRVPGTLTIFGLRFRAAILLGGDFPCRRARPDSNYRGLKAPVRYRPAAIPVILGGRLCRLEGRLANARLAFPGTAFARRASRPCRSRLAIARPVGAIGASPDRLAPARYAFWRQGHDGIVF